MTLGFQREVAPEVSLGITYIRRDFENQLQDIDVNHYTVRDPVTGKFVDQLGEEGLGVHRAGRGVGAVDDDRPRVRADRAPDVLHPRLEAAVLRRDHDRHAVAHLDHLGVADPVRRQHDHLVPGIQDREQGVEERLLRTRRHDDLGGGFGRRGLRDRGWRREQRRNRFQN